MNCYRFVVVFKPFRIDAFLNDRLMVKVNGDNLLNFEFERTNKEQADIFDAEILDSTYQQFFGFNKNNEFLEFFDGTYDVMRYGPRAISLDFQFANQHLFGIPQRAKGFALDDTIERDTISAINEKTEPYRLYNLDVASYNTDSTQSLYGSVPFLLSHDGSSKGNAGIYWCNAAETWVEIYSFDSELKRGSSWVSESGSMEFFILLGRSPKEVIHKLSNVAGHAPMPPYFSLGYH